MVQRGASNNIINNVTAQILLPLIQRWILPGTTVMSDMFLSYRNIAMLPQGYTHLVVNHRVRKYNNIAVQNTTIPKCLH